MTDELSPPPTLTAHGATHPGRQRSENEDAFGVFAEERFFIVADGVGGHHAGEVASRMTVDGLARFFRTFHADPRQKWPYPIDRDLSLGGNLLKVGIRVANDEVRAAAGEDNTRLRMASTVVALTIGDRQMAVAHLGDARAYRLRRGFLSRLTRDHSVIEEMMALQPQLKPEDLAGFAHRNVITRSVGSKPDVEPEVRTLEVERGDVYLLCTDGLSAPLDDETIARMLIAHPEPSLACQQLIDAANAAGGPDNVTAVVVRVDA